VNYFFFNFFLTFKTKPNQMNWIPKKTKEVATVASPQEISKAVWDKLTKLKEQKAELEAEIAKTQEELIEQAEAQKLWKGKTATFPNGRKIHDGSYYKIIVIGEMDKKTFAAQYPDFAKIELAEQALVRSLLKGGNDELREFFELEEKQSFKFV
jgi:hypothetical protein